MRHTTHRKGLPDRHSRLEAADCSNGCRQRRQSCGRHGVVRRLSTLSASTLSPEIRRLVLTSLVVFSLCYRLQAGADCTRTDARGKTARVLAAEGFNPSPIVQQMLSEWEQVHATLAAAVREAKSRPRIVDFVVHNPDGSSTVALNMVDTMVPTGGLLSAAA